MDLIYGDIWYDVEVWGGDIPTHWMSNDARISIFSEEPVSARASFKVMSFNKQLRLKVYLNDELISEELIASYFKKVVIYVKLIAGKNIIRFHSADGSLRPFDIPNLCSDDLRHLSFAFQDIQLSAIDISNFDYQKYPLKLNLGCGFDKLKDYCNVDLQDFHKPDLVADIRNLNMLPSGMYEEILAQDVLEHLPQIDIIPTLSEWFRLLRIGGVLKLRVPNLTGLLQLLENNKSIEDQERLIKCLFGTQAYEGDYHLSGFTKEILNYYLSNVGFNHIVFATKDHWLFEISAKKTFMTKGSPRRL